MSDIESLQYLSGQLRHGAQQFSTASQTLGLQARNLDWSAQDLASGASAWAGRGSQNFTTAWNTYHQSTQKAVTALDNTSQALSRLAQKIDETVQQLQQQQAQQNATAIGLGVLTVGLVVLDVLQLGLDPVTDGLTVAAGSADAAAVTGTEAAAGSAEVAAQGLVEADAQIAGDLDEIASGIDNVADSGNIAADGGGAPGDITVDEGPFGNGGSSGDGAGGDGSGNGGPPDNGEPSGNAGDSSGGDGSGSSKSSYTDPSNIENPMARSYAERMYNAVEDHLTPDDLQGAWRDLHGDPVPNPNTGGYYDHLGEVNDAMRSIRNTIETFKELLDNTGISSSDRSIIQDMLSKGSKTLDYVEKVISRDQWFPGTHIPFP